MATPTFSTLNPSQTATLISTYVPPFATSTTFVASHVSTGSGTQAGGFNPIPATSSYPANPTAPAFQDDVSWVTGYLLIHSLSATSYVYAYFLWFAVVAVFVLMAILRLTGMRGGVLGAIWQKWALRRRTWRKKHALREAEKEARKKGVPVSSVHRQPKALPSNAQLLTFALIVIAVVVLCVAGPDYINPDARLFTFPSTPSSSSSSSNTKRASTNGSSSVSSIVSFFTAHYTIPKALWTSAARTGNIAFALFPLTILLALKAPPFAVFAIPWFVNLHFDKLVRMHRWAGRMVWVATTAHVVMWCIQLGRDVRAGTDQTAWHFAFEYTKFRFGWAAYALLTLMVFTSLESLRARRFAIFYGLHIVLTPAMLITAGLHHPPVAFWCWAALGLWVGERVWRFVWFLYTNGLVGDVVPKGARVGNTNNVEDEKTAVSRAVTKNSLSTTTTAVSSDRGVEKARPHSYAPSESWEMDELKSPLSARSPSGLLQIQGQGHGQVQTGIPPTVLANRPQTPDSDYSSDRRSSYFDVANVGGSGGFGPQNRQGSFAPTPGASGFGVVGTSASTPTGGAGLGLGYAPATPGETTRTQTPVSFNSRAPLNPALNAPSPSMTPVPGKGPNDQGPLPSQYVPPPGFAHATLLPGRTVRLRLVTPGYLAWAPGQHFLLCIPSVSKLATHPFSVASVCDEQAAVRFEQAPDQEVGSKVISTEAGREMVLLVRAKKGWTKRLWDLVYRMQEQGESVPTGEELPPGFSPPPRGPSAPHAGIVLRTLVDGPFGSSGRVNWGAYSSVLVVAGGSGVSFGTSIFEYVCLCLAGRDGRFLGGHAGRFGAPGWETQRVRFVWLVREYAHIQWVATTLRRCMEILPSDALEVNIWVTNYKPPKEIKPPLSVPTFPSLNSAPGFDTDDKELAPPVPQFARKARPLSVGSEDSVDSDVSVDSITDLYFESDEEGKRWSSNGDGARNADEASLGHETHVLDYTNFDGDNDDPLPGENRLSRKVKKESKLRRAKTRKTEKALTAKQELEERANAVRSPIDTNVQNGFVASHRQSGLSTTSSAPLLAGSPPQSPSTSSLYSPFSDQAPANRLGGSAPYLPGRLHPNDESIAPGDASKRRSIRPLSVASSAYTATFDAQSMRWQEPFGASAEATGLTIDPQEIQDLRVVSEVARPGKPKLDRILVDEVERSKGRVIVACCGPTSLNALMRKIVAAKIDPKRIMKGDMRGYIDFMCEDFDY